MTSLKKTLNLGISLKAYVATVDGMGARSNFHFSDAEEPHAKRRAAILERHPEIAELFGYDSRPIPYVIAIFLSQLSIAYFQRDWSLTFFLFIAWTYGGAASHALSLMTHECSHNLVCKSRADNEYFGIFCNIAMGVPSSTTFKRYHMEHHQFQGDRQKDADIPLNWEGKIFNSAPMKLMWLLFQPFFYAFRPTFSNPKTLRALDLMNLFVVVLTDIIVVFCFGPRALLYLVLSTILGMGLHPVAGHFIAEHYVFEKSHETYSYYGSLNLLCWNVGFHNEHHDFPKVPGWRLPLVKKMAPEFYDHLPYHSSWTYAMWRYVVDPSISPFSRVIRSKSMRNV